MHRHPRLHDSRRNKNSNARWWAHRRAVRTSTLWLAIDQSWGKERFAAVLVIQRWDRNHRQQCNEKPKNNNTYSVTGQGTKATAHEPNGNREDKATSAWAHVLDHMNTDIEKMIIIASQATWPKGNSVSYEIPGRPWESLGPDILTLLTSIIFVL